MKVINLLAAWVGCLCGIIPGLMFRRETWMGGYASWPRRLSRLGHVSFFGIAGDPTPLIRGSALPEAKEILTNFRY